MVKTQFLSYSINRKTPVYPGGSAVLIDKARQIMDGDSCNTSLLTISNHTGTHIDAPWHFVENGKKIGDYRPDEFVFRQPYVIECRKKPGEAIQVSDIKIKGNAKNTDILLIKTGFAKYRSSDPEKYRYKNPYLSPKAAGFIAGAFPFLRAVGIDTISISSKIDSKPGRRSHRILLRKNILIVEDVKILPGIKMMDEIIIFPLFSGCPDGSPCVIIGLRYD
jgi:kynurenine formamidase